MEDLTIDNRTAKFMGRRKRNSSTLVNDEVASGTGENKIASLPRVGHSVIFPVARANDERIRRSGFIGNEHMPIRSAIMFWNSMYWLTNHSSARHRPISSSAARSTRVKWIGRPCTPISCSVTESNLPILAAALADCS